MRLTKKETELINSKATPSTQQESNQENSLDDKILQNQKKVNSGKKRNWACVVYPESLPENWLELLTLTGLQVAISPLHDKDLEADGITPKKSHYHLIMCYSGPTSYSVVKGLTDKLNAPGPIPLEQVRGYYRYLTHKDNPEKYQYDERDIKCLNGFNIADFTELTHSEVLNITIKIANVIRARNITEYCDLVFYALDECSLDEQDVVRSHTIFFNAYIKSLKYKSEQDKQLEGVPKEYWNVIQKMTPENLRKLADDLEKNTP